jgi:hypothetical protein
VSNHRTHLFFGIAMVFAALSFFASLVVGQPLRSSTSSPTAFRVGERITYTLSLGGFRDVGYAEIHVASRGALSGRDAIELRSKFRTLNLFSAAFYEADEARTVFVDPVSGAPLYAKRTRNPDGLPSETTNDFTKDPAAGLDLLSLIYRIRHSGGTGSANLFENGRLYAVTYSSEETESVRTPAGDFDTAVVSVQSEYFTELGFKEVLVNLSNDEARIPAMIRVRTKRYELRAVAASVQLAVPEPEVIPGPTPAPTIAPVPTPTPARTPEPYVDNLPLNGDLAFQLGESLDYKVTAGGRPVGTFVMRARERHNIGGRDTLVLSATVTSAVSGNPVLALNDSITAFVDPESLAPRQMEIKLQTGLSSLNQTVSFDPRSGAITYRGNNRVDAPVGTHSFLSLIYAMRSFNLRMSKTRDNPVNDTRVAVFWESQAYIFKLRPDVEAAIEVGGEKVLTQPVSITTDNPQLDALGLRIWLSTDGRRIPLRFTAGPYQAELVSATNIPLK